MCFTGNFALTMMLEPAMLAPAVLPAVAAAGRPRRHRDVAADDTRGGARAAGARRTSSVMAYRFDGDRFCTAERFAAYCAGAGRALRRARVARRRSEHRTRRRSSRGVVASPHSVVTAHLIDEAGQPTLAARDEILAFFARRLLDRRR